MCVRAYAHDWICWRTWVCARMSFGLSTMFLLHITIVSCPKLQQIRNNNSAKCTWPNSMVYVPPYIPFHSVRHSALNIGSFIMLLHTICFYYSHTHSVCVCVRFSVRISYVSFVYFSQPTKPNFRLFHWLRSFFLRLKVEQRFVFTVAVVWAAAMRFNTSPQNVHFISFRVVHTFYPLVETTTKLNGHTQHTHRIEIMKTLLAVSCYYSNSTLCV